MKLLLMPFCLISFQRFSLFVACSESVSFMKRQSSTNLVFQTQEKIKMAAHETADEKLIGDYISISWDL